MATTATTQPATQQRKARGPHIDETALMLALREDPEAALRPYVDAAQVDWETNAPQAYRPLLLAAVLMAANTTARRASIPTVFAWDDTKGQYRLRDKVISNGELVDAFDFYVQSKISSATATAKPKKAARKKPAAAKSAETAPEPEAEPELVDSIFQGLRDGSRNVKETQLAGEHSITLAHVAAALVAIGGLRNLTGATLVLVGAMLSEHLEEWRDRMRSVANGAPVDGRVRVVLQNLIRAAGASHLVVQGALMARYGFDQCRNILRDGAHHCVTHKGRPSCTSITERGWVAIAQRVERGLRACWWNCRCRWLYRNSTTGETRY